LRKNPEPTNPAQDHLNTGKIVFGTAGVIGISKGGDDDNHPVSHPGSSVDWSYSSVAVQPQLGAISQRNAWTGSSDCGRPYVAEGVLRQAGSGQPV
jgi:hypothetical protein